MRRGKYNKRKSNKEWEELEKYFKQNYLLNKRKTKEYFLNNNISESTFYEKRAIWFSEMDQD
jgi:hypothetical protein